MSKSEHSLLPSLALDLASQLEAYRGHCRELRRNPNDRAAQQRVRDALRGMGHLASMLPAIWVPWGAMVVLHFKLMHPRWRSGEADVPALRAVGQDHEEAVELLQRRCVGWVQEQRASQRPTPGDAVVDAFAAWDSVRFRLRQSERDEAQPAGDGVPAAGLREESDALLRAAVARLRNEPLR